MDVKYLRGTRAQYNAYKEAEKLVSYYYYLITEEDGSISLYLGDQKLNNVKEIAALESSLGLRLTTVEGKVGTLETDVAWLKDNAGHKFFEVTELPAFGEGHTYKEGDVCIVTVTENGVEFKTAYHCIKNAEGAFAWAAMAGNYSAADVYLDTAITLSGDYGSVYDTADKKYYAITTIGNKKIGDTIAAGTSVQSLFSDILSKRIQPTITAAPSASISVSGSDGDKEVGTSYTKPTATLKVKSGSYTNEGTATGVKYTAGKVVIAYGADPDTSDYTATNTADLGNDGTVSIGPSVYSANATTALYTDSQVSYTFSGKATHTAGNVAKDNLGSDSNPTIQIASASPTVGDKSASFRGFRKMFVGCTTEALSSSVIRGLSLKSAKASTSAFEVTAPIGATKLVIAAPTNSCGKNYQLSKAEMMTMSYEDYTSKFVTESKVSVADAQSSGDKNLQAYNIYTYSFAPLQADTKFRITLK